MSTDFDFYTKAMKLFSTAKLKTVTPTQMVDALVVNAPASKQAWCLKKLGFVIQANKDGRAVVSYTLLTAPASAPAQKVAAAKPAPKAKTVKPSKPVLKSKTAPAVAVTAAAKKSPTAKKGLTPADAAAKLMSIRQAKDDAMADGAGIADIDELDTRDDLPDNLR